MLGMGGNSKKGLVSVLLNKEGEATNNPEKDPQAINPDQGMIDACSELLKSIEKKDPKRMARCFRAIYSMCEDDHEEDESSDY